MGAPSSGKSTLATSVQYSMKKAGMNSVFVTEAATDYIAEYGIPNSAIEQMVIFYKQLNREKMYLDSKDYIICDSSSLLNYFYFRTMFPNKPSAKDIATINHVQKEILKSINQWDYIFYIPPMDIDPSDGIRFHVQSEIYELDIRIKAYLNMENINFIDLSDVPLDDRDTFIINTITKDSTK